MIVDLPPALLLIAGALVVPFLRGPLRAAWMVGVAVAALVNFVGVEHGTHWQVGVFGYTLELGRVDKLGYLFGLLFHIAALLAVIYSLHVKDTVQQVAALAYAGSAIGAVTAGDWITLFVWWELLALTSVFLVWAGRSEKTYAAGVRYLLVNIASGLLLLAGILFRTNDGGSLSIEPMLLGDTASVLIFLAIGIKCAFPLAHGWVIDAYPRATPTGTVFLSAFTTKAAVYLLARVFPGAEPLIWIGLVMASFPIFYAVIENDLRRVLSYSMINQVGFMVVGIGIGTPLAIDGAVAHAFADVIFKGLLFMAMGAVLMRTGTANGTDLGGLYKSMPWTTGFCLVGAASISAFPLFSAFVTKSMILSAALAEHHYLVWWVLLFASAGVLEHAGIKIPYFAFFAHDSGKRPKEAPWNMLVAMAIGSVLCIVIGSFPSLLYGLLPYEPMLHGHAYTPYDATHVVTQMQLLLFAILAVWWLMKAGIYPPEERKINLDVDRLYRALARGFWWIVTVPLAHLGKAIDSAVLERIPARVVAFAGFAHAEERAHRGWVTGASVLIALILLVGYLLVYYLSG